MYYPFYIRRLPLLSVTCYRLCAASVITLTLLHPIHLTPVQNWTFEHEPVIRIGRSTDNHVILYSAVVSRHHVELRQINSHWEIVNLGANGTYLDGKRVTQVPVEDGVIIRLARSGPNIQIHIGQAVPKASQSLAGEKTLAQREKGRSGSSTEPKVSANPASDPLPITYQPESEDAGPSAAGKLPSTAVDQEHSPSAATPVVNNPVGKSPDQSNSEDLLFCQTSGQPLRILQTLVEYQVVKTLKDDGISITQVVWRNGQSLLLRTLSQEWMHHPKALELFEQQAKALIQLSHPGIPRFVDFFLAEGQPYLIMEWVHGQDLSQQVMKNGPFSQDEAIATILQVCDVLDYLHQQPLPFIHQDIRPENLIQRPSTFNPYTIAVVGFASLKELAEDTSLAPSGYTAPEQRRGHPTPASDLYALGPVLVYLLTGKEPQEFYAQREQGFRLYPEYVPGLSPEMVTVIRKLTNPPLEDRYSSAREVAEALSLMLEA
ncbi:protein kinase domain-containing protein [Leptothermofonsia sp. ETS-13]|uniref:protein kinase domain-containing protein n=1 Tax=Leptothermofonsia sp. ETS-13 TaxID=3035696 RepID=UPI003BA20237